MPDTPVLPSLLDGLTLGNPMSLRQGVQCFPAIRTGTEKRLIVKTLLFPPSQVQLDALMLTRAYPDMGRAMDYFRQQAEDVAREAEILKKMAELEGFLPYDGCQIVPADPGLGYKAVLLSPYRRSLEQYLQKNAMTHLSAVNLGLDISGALAACRQAGYLYIDLKPGNIFLSGSGKEYRIGDLGFAALDTLKFASMPQRYYSPYTAPEVSANLDALSETMDVYALGRILYEIYNGGELPSDVTRPLPPPSYADSAMAEILLKATDPDPAGRYSSPVELGKALAAYLQKETVNDVPIAPPKKRSKPLAPVSGQSASAPEAVLPEAPPAMDDIAAALTREEPPQREKPEAAPPQEEPAAQEAASQVVPDGESPREDAPAEAAPPLFPELPDGSAPDEDAGAPDAFEAELKALNQLLTEPAAVSPPTEEAPTAPPEEKKKGKSLLRVLLGILLGIALAAAVYFSLGFYRNYYLQSVNAITVTGSQNEMTVSVDTTAGTSLITVVCADAYGNTLRESLTEGAAHFTGLTPDSLYKITLEISGLHKLVGQISDIFTTPGETMITELSATAEAEEGALQLTLSVQGYTPDSWVVTYTAEGEEDGSVTFSGSSVRLTGLTVGKTYTLSLTTPEDILLAGNTTLSYTVKPILTAENLRITSVLGGELTAQWDAPENGTVDSWTVRCYGEGYDETQTVTEQSATFPIGSAKGGFTVEVTAGDMPRLVRTTLSANPISVTGWTVDDSGDNSLTVSWEFEGDAPESGWLLLYSMDGGEVQNVVKCTEPTAVIDNKLPGVTYSITLQTGDSTTVFRNTTEFTVPQGEDFLGHGISIYKISAKLLPTPDDPAWRKEDLTGSEYTTVFTPGQGISAVLYVDTRFYLDHEDQEILYILRDGEGKVYGNQYTTAKMDWYSIWFDGDYHYGELNGPAAPGEAGSYQLDIYFNRMRVATLPFTVES